MAKKTVEVLHILEKLEAFVPRFNPPVFAFEKSIRHSPFRILVSVLLSSRTKDEVTKAASEKLFAAADTPSKMAVLGEEKIQELIYPVGFFRQKAKNIIEICRRLEQKNGFPQTLEELTVLPGVGRKTANLVLALSFNIPSIAVDTHVFRISKRLGWSQGEKPEEVETDLKTLFPPDSWSRINQTLVGFGQTICKPIGPKCQECILRPTCPYYKTLQKKPRDKAKV